MLLMLLLLLLLLLYVWNIVVLCALQGTESFGFEMIADIYTLMTDASAEKKR